MATRADIIDAFYDELVAAAKGDHTVTRGDGSTYTITVDENDIALRNPETERLPQVVYNDTFRRVVYNGVGRGPDAVRYNEDGSTDAEIWREYVEAQFLVDVRAHNALEKEPIYEAVRASFGKYSYGAWDTSDLHGDITNVSVRDSTSTDIGDEEEVIRGDQLEIRITFHRDYEFSTDNVESIEHNVENETFTTT